MKGKESASGKSPSLIVLDASCEPASAGSINPNPAGPINPSPEGPVNPEPTGPAPAIFKIITEMSETSARVIVMETRLIMANVARRPPALEATFRRRA